MIAASAPSGTNKQPWTFCAISNPKLKATIRKAAEEEEYESYNGRVNKEWLEDLKKFNTDWQKPFLETAHWIIVVFKEVYEMGVEGEKKQNYYVNEHVGIACGFFNFCHSRSWTRYAYAHAKPDEFPVENFKPSHKRTLIFVATHRLSSS
jgi:hypothetical protein